MQSFNDRPQVLKAKFGEELRRIALTANNFDQLNKQIAQLFSLPLGNFTLQYHDDENDLITLSTDLEFKEASRCSEKVLRIKVNAKNRNKKGACRNNKNKKGTCHNNRNNNKCHQNNKEKNPNIIHQSLANLAKELFQKDFHVEQSYICDGCEIDISGARFHCNDCKDFDFCQACFVKKDACHFQSQHRFTKFDALENKNEGNSETKKVHPAICDRCEVQIEGIRYKSLDCNDFDLCSDCHEMCAGKEDVGNHLKEYQFGKIVDPEDEHLFYLQVQRHEKQRGEERRAALFEKKRKELLQKKKELEVRQKQEMQKLLQQTQSMESKRSDWTFPQKKIVYPFEDKLALLKKMGFNDRQQNVKVFLENKEDFMRSVQQLLGSRNNTK